MVEVRVEVQVSPGFVIMFLGWTSSRAVGNVAKMDGIQIRNNIWINDKGLLEKRRTIQISLQQELSFYWLNLSSQEDSCIAKTELGTSSSAVVIYSLKHHKNRDAVRCRNVTGQKDTGTPSQHVTMGWWGSRGWLRHWEGEGAGCHMTEAHITSWLCGLPGYEQMCPRLQLCWAPC